MFPPLSSVLLSLLVAPLAVLAIKIFRRFLTNYDVLSLPCPPKPTWIWGHELEAYERPSGEFYTECIEVCGPTYRIKGALGHKDILVLADPKGVAHLHRNIYNYPHAATIRTLVARLIGRGLVWIEGEAEHKRMRRPLNPAFSAESVKLMTPAIYDSAGKTRIANEVVKNGGKVELNLTEVCSDATLDIIGKVAFDHDFGQGSSLEAKRIASAWKTQAALSLTRAGFIAMVTLRLFPFLTSLPLEALQAQGETKTVVKACVIHSGIDVKETNANMLSGQRIASKMVECDDSETGDGNSLLSILLRASLRDKEPIDKDELLDQICTFVMAGHETTAGCLSHTLWALARHPEKQRQLREEVMSFPGNPTYEDFQKTLPYLDACCKEGLRLYPSVPHMERVVENEDIIPLQFPFTNSTGTQCSSIRVEKGQVVALPLISINCLKSVWGDGEMFRPERWLESAESVSDVKFEGWSNMLTFIDGPRTCIGYRLAVFEMKAIIFTLVRNFVFHDTGAKIKSRFAAALQPRVVGRESEGIQLPIRITLA